MSYYIIQYHITIIPYHTTQSHTTTVIHHTTLPPHCTNTHYTNILVVIYSVNHTRQHYHTPPHSHVKHTTAAHYTPVTQHIMAMHISHTSHQSRTSLNTAILDTITTITYCNTHPNITNTITPVTHQFMGKQHTTVTHHTGTSPYTCKHFTKDRELSHSLIIYQGATTG